MPPNAKSFPNAFEAAEDEEDNKAENIVPESYFAKGYTGNQPLVTPLRWLRAKRKLDGAEGLWRVHDKLYDLSAFNHPGGQLWLEILQGTDITEHYEIHHQTGHPEILQKYFVREARTPRISPFTFHEDGFYKSFKRRAKVILEKVGSGPERSNKLLVDANAIVFLLLLTLCGTYSTWSIALSAGVAMTFLVLSSHNFVHQKINFRSIYMDFSVFGSLNWRLQHCLSHHVFPNTIQDVEVTGIIPLLDFLTRPKNLFQKYLYPLTITVVTPLIFPIVTPFLTTYWEIYQGNIKFRTEHSFLPLEILYAASLSGSLWTGIWAFWVIHGFTAVLLIFIGKAAGHHHPEVYSDGDRLRPENQRDWGIFQLDTVVDRPEVVERGPSLFLLGHHLLHHLVPAVDDSKLIYLYPALLETLEEFNLGYQFMPYYRCLYGMAAQLSKEKPFTRERPTDRSQLVKFVKSRSS
ncbi:unnamed protein product [Cyprideis torosa]|uniref:Uncharacterized protein n=1 Tax=Cyprideis torosa TaxID=163714 RepID=A0A7R8W3F5_9CRUS|nr:unnamed protein product [Cyprideis torosa]CAG0882813.1 unnamed protein product [Cyprideis torosa]